MPIKKAIEYVKLNKNKFKEFALGDNTSYNIRKNSLIEKNGELVSITFWSKKNLNLNQAEQYLLSTKKYLESQGYKTVFLQKNWSKPLLLNKNQPCIRFSDKNKNVIVSMEPRGQGSIYNVFLTFYSFNWFVNQASGKN